MLQLQNLPVPIDDVRSVVGQGHVSQAQVFEDVYMIHA